MFAFLSTKTDFLFPLILFTYCRLTYWKKKHLPSQLKTIFFNKHGTCLLNCPRHCWEHLGQVLWSDGVSGKNSIRPAPEHLDFKISSKEENTHFWEMLRWKEIFSKERLLYLLLYLHTHKKAVCNSSCKNLHVSFLRGNTPDIILLYAIYTCVRAVK